MKRLQIKSKPDVKFLFENYPHSVREKMLELRRLVIETAEEQEEINLLEETLKWGEPSYLTKNGSTIRMDWKAKSPDQYALYFQCTSRLISTFKLVYKNELEFEGNRAIVLKLDESLPKNALKACIKAALTYHKVKHLPALGL